MRAVTRFALFIAMLALAAIEPASPAGASTSGNQQFVITITDLSGTGRVVATGPIDGVGTNRLLAHTDNADGSSTDIDEFELPDGTVALSDTYRVEYSSNPESCVTRIEVSGTYMLIGGTGAYTGITGSGMFTASGTFVAGRDGAGGCLGFDGDPRAFVEIVEGAGTTTLA